MPQWRSSWVKGSVSFSYNRISEDGVTFQVGFVALNNNCALAKCSKGSFDWLWHQEACDFFLVD